VFDLGGEPDQKGLLMTKYGIRWEGKGRCMPEDLDWVERRSLCALPDIFNRLRIQIENDVNKRTALSSKDNYQFRFVGEENVVSVCGYYKNVPMNCIPAVNFRLEDKHIRISSTDNKIDFEATLTLNDFGDCKLCVNGEERELWQVRRQALEHLFFGTF
jgi:hypothetical protein